MKTLVIDVGGTHVKLSATGRRNVLAIPSGPKMTARRMVTEVLQSVLGWEYHTVSIGYPGPVRGNKPARDPHNLGPGWVRFNFEKAFRCPVRIVNDAAMQALGSYEGGRMLFLGLGTGLGSAVIAEGVLQPMELAHLPYRRNRTFEEYVGIAGLKRLGEQRWRQHALRIMKQLKDALQVDYVVLGGGNSKRFEALPAGVRHGDNSNAFRGGFRLWRNPHKEGKKR
jgi:predicted NBD/HSP70 family sugar kinase